MNIGVLHDSGHCNRGALALMCCHVSCSGLVVHCVSTMCLRALLSRPTNVLSTERLLRKVLIKAWSLVLCFGRCARLRPCNSVSCFSLNSASGPASADQRVLLRITTRSRRARVEGSPPWHSFQSERTPATPLRARLPRAASQRWCASWRLKRKVFPGRSAHARGRTTRGSPYMRLHWLRRRSECTSFGSIRADAWPQAAEPSGREAHLSRSPPTKWQRGSPRPSQSGTRGGAGRAGATPYPALSTKC